MLMIIIIWNIMPIVVVWKYVPLIVTNAQGWIIMGFVL